MLISIVCISIAAFSYYNPPVVNHNTVYVVTKSSDAHAHELYTMYHTMMDIAGNRVCKQWRSSMLAFVEWGYANGWYQGAVLIKTTNTREYSPLTCRFV